MKRDALWGLLFVGMLALIWGIAFSSPTVTWHDHLLDQRGNVLSGYWVGFYRSSDTVCVAVDTAAGVDGYSMSLPAGTYLVYVAKNGVGATDTSYEKTVIVPWDAMEALDSLTVTTKIAGSIDSSIVAGEAWGPADDDWVVPDTMKATTLRATGNLAVGGNASIGDTLTIGGHTQVNSTLSVLKIINTDSLYMIGDVPVLSINGNYNVFVGESTGCSNTTGDGNVFAGCRAGYSNTIGYDNAFVGYKAGYSNTVGLNNNFIGFNSGYANVDGHHNFCLGNHAGHFNVSGCRNLMLGTSAGERGVGAERNVYIGYRAGYWGAGTTNVCIGYEAGFNETGNNKLYIATGPDTADVLIYGEFDNDKVGINTLTPTEALEVVGNIKVDTVKAAVQGNIVGDLTGNADTADSAIVAADWTAKDTKVDVNDAYVYRQTVPIYSGQVMGGFLETTEVGDSVNFYFSPIIDTIVVDAITMSYYITVAGGDWRTIIMCGSDTVCTHRDSVVAPTWIHWDTTNVNYELPPNKGFWYIIEELGGAAVFRYICIWAEIYSSNVGP